MNASKPLAASTLALSLLLASCGGGNGEWVELESSEGGTAETIHIQGTVNFMDIEGGLYVIRDVDGTQYNPSNLPARFKTDGMRVEAFGRRRDDMAGIGMSGPILELVRIRERPAE